MNVVKEIVLEIVLASALTVMYNCARKHLEKQKRKRARI